MHHTLLLSKYKTSSRYALLDGKNIPLEFGIDYPISRNAIYLTKVLDINPSFGMVFFDLSPAFKQPGLLSTTPSSAKQFHIGQSLLVQIRTAPLPTSFSLRPKGPKVTPEIRFSCPYFIYFPKVPGIFYSKRLNKKKIDSFLPSLKSLLSPQEGLILRPLCENASLFSLQSHLKKIKALSQLSLEGSKIAPLGTCVYMPPSSFFQKLEEVGYTLSKILVDDKNLFKEVNNFVKIYDLSCSVEFKRNNPLQESLFDSFSLEETWEDALSPFVPLPSGGNLIIEKTEGFWAVDINGQGREGVPGALTPKTLNEEAAHALFRTLLLRNLGGKIIIDFLPLVQKEEFQNFYIFLTNQASFDPVSLKISGLNRSGLCEIIRERTDLSLAEAAQLS